MYIMGKAEIDAVRKVIQSGRLFRYHAGKIHPVIGAFETGLARKIGTRYAFSTSSGTASLIAALVGLDIGPGDEVIVPGYTYVATAIAPVAIGAVPIIADVDESLTLDPGDMERKITRHTKAIIPVYMLGLPCRMDAILRIARKHGIPVLEDVAQADGGSYRGRRFGSLGAVGAFSFNFYKIISCGEGGGIVTNDRTIFERAVMYHDCGYSYFSNEKPATTPFYAGVNYRISVVQAAILNEQLKRLDGILGKLRARKNAMAEVLAGAKGFRPSPNNDVKGDCATHLPILFASADQAVAFQKEHARACPMFRPIDTGRHVYSFWEPIMEQRTHTPRMSPWKLSGRKYHYAKDMLPRTSDILARTVCLRIPIEKTLPQVRAMARKFCAFAST
jgi:dTDP-4-amino-4,6-dideoxygalactose transaminase